MLEVIGFFHILKCLLAYLYGLIAGEFETKKDKGSNFVKGIKNVNETISE